MQGTRQSGGDKAICLDGNAQGRPDSRAGGSCQGSPVLLRGPRYRFRQSAEVILLDDDSVDLNQLANETSMPSPGVSGVAGLDQYNRTRASGRGTQSPQSTPCVETQARVGNLTEPVSEGPGQETRRVGGGCDEVDPSGSAKASAVGRESVAPMAREISASTPMSIGKAENASNKDLPVTGVDAANSASERVCVEQQRTASPTLSTLEATDTGNLIGASKTRQSNDLAATVTPAQVPESTSPTQITNVGPGMESISSPAVPDGVLTASAQDSGLLQSEKDCQTPMIDSDSQCTDEEEVYEARRERAKFLREREFLRKVETDNQYSLRRRSLMDSLQIEHATPEPLLDEDAAGSPSSTTLAESFASDADKGHLERHIAGTVGNRMSIFRQPAALTSMMRLDGIMRFRLRNKRLLGSIANEEKIKQVVEANLPALPIRNAWRVSDMLLPFAPPQPCLFSPNRLESIRAFRRRHHSRMRNRDMSVSHESSLVAWSGEKKFMLCPCGSKSSCPNQNRFEQSTARLNEPEGVDADLWSTWASLDFDKSDAWPELPSEQANV